MMQVNEAAATKVSHAVVVNTGNMFHVRINRGKVQYLLEDPGLPSFSKASAIDIVLKNYPKQEVVFSFVKKTPDAQEVPY